MGREHGVTEAQLRDLAEFETSDAFSEPQKLALRYATAMTATPVEVSVALVEELKKHLTDAQLVELTSAIAWEQYRARFDHALGIEAEGFSEGVFCPLPAAAQSTHAQADISASSSWSAED